MAATPLPFARFGDAKTDPHVRPKLKPWKKETQLDILRVSVENHYIRWTFKKNHQDFDPTIAYRLGLLK